MKQYLIRSCLFCGVATFAVNLILAALKMPFLLLWTSNIFPGFVFGYVLADTIKANIDSRSFLFILLSGGLYILVAWMATGYSFLGNKIYICYPIASVLGSTLLLLLLTLLLDNKIVFVVGLKYAVLTGLVSSILPVIGSVFISKLGDSDRLSLVTFMLNLSVFLTWQPLFAWSISKQAGSR